MSSKIKRQWQIFQLKFVKSTSEAGKSWDVRAGTCTSAGCNRSALQSHPALTNSYVPGDYVKRVAISHKRRVIIGGLGYRTTEKFPKIKNRQLH